MAHQVMVTECDLTHKPRYFDKKPESRGGSHGFVEVVRCRHVDVMPRVYTKKVVSMGLMTMNDLRPMLQDPTSNQEEACDDRGTSSQPTPPG